MNAPNPDRAAKDAAYAERNRLVALLAALFPGSLEENAAGSPADRAEGWNWVVYVGLPTGQATWHLHDRELPLFAHVPRNQGRTWDGHTTEEKYARVERLAAQTGRHPDSCRRCVAAREAVKAVPLAYVAGLFGAPAPGAVRRGYECPEHGYQEMAVGIHTVVHPRQSRWARFADAEPGTVVELTPEEDARA